MGVSVSNDSFPLSGTVWFGTVQYGTQLFPFPLSEVVNGTKIANRTCKGASGVSTAEKKSPKMF